mmetsp:Transcript_9426/g.29296  ORF Transcript_9426/g.29296 Transcript_9426/m.29296 type:complete len:370 (+) Transcript_9426:446-1555(+)
MVQPQRERVAVERHAAVARMGQVIELLQGSMRQRAVRVERRSDGLNLSRRCVRLAHGRLQLRHDDLALIGAAHVEEARGAQAVRGAVHVVWHQDADGALLALLKGAQSGQELGTLGEEHGAIQGLPVEVGQEHAPAGPVRHGREVPLDVLAVLGGDELEAAHDLRGRREGLGERKRGVEIRRQPACHGLLRVRNHLLPAAVAGLNRPPLLGSHLWGHRVAAPVLQAEEVCHVRLQCIDDVRPARRTVGRQAVRAVGSLQPLDQVTLDQMLQSRHEHCQLADAQTAATLPLLDKLLEVLGNLPSQCLPGRRRGLGLAHRVQAPDVPGMLPDKVLVKRIAHRGVLKAASRVFGQGGEEPAQRVLDILQVLC